MTNDRSLMSCVNARFDTVMLKFHCKVLLINTGNNLNIDVIFGTYKHTFFSCIFKFDYMQFHGKSKRLFCRYHVKYFYW